MAREAIDEPGAVTSNAGATKHQARQLFETGKLALTSGRFAEARDVFRRSLQLHPHLSTVFNLAVALRGTGQAVEALGWLERLESRAFGELTSARRRQVATMRAALEGTVARVTARTRAKGNTELRVDGLTKGRMRAGRPLHLRLDPGKHVLAAHAAGMRPEERTLRLRPGQRISLQLTPLPRIRPGTLLVQSSVKAAVVEIVGIARATGQLRRQLAPGSYLVRARADGASDERRVEVPGGRWISVRLDPRRSIWRSPWLWTAIGAVVVGGVVTAAVLATRSADEIGPPLVYTLR